MKTKKHPMYDALEAHLDGTDSSAALYWLTSHLADCAARLDDVEKRNDQILEMISGIIEVEQNVLKSIDDLKRRKCGGCK